jgi:hypothetical protein
MKKIIIGLVMMFTINFINVQEQKISYYPNSTNIKDTGKIDKNNYPFGIWKYYLITGSVDYIINWKTNYIKQYYATGELKEEGTFMPETGVHIKKWATYSKNGKIKTQEVFDENGIKQTE